MPQQVKPTAETMHQSFERLNAEEFSTLDRDSTIAILPYKEAIEKFFKIDPKHRGLQVVLVYTFGYFSVYVLTTFVLETGEVKDSDEGWAFIVDKRFPKNPCFFSFPMRRTKNYVPTMELWALSQKNRIDTMPCCPECNTKLTIKLVLNGKMHSYTLVCPNKKFKHLKFRFLSFYTGMDPKHQKFMEQRFEAYAKYTDKNIEANNIRTPDRVLRSQRKNKKIGVHNIVNEHTDPEPDYNVPDD